jgi:hypothetical protein
MRTISTRRTTIAAALEYARSEHETLYREAGSTALESGDDADEAQATYCRSVIAHPGSASDAWVNAGASKLCGSRAAAGAGGDTGLVGFSVGRQLFELLSREGSAP